MDSFSQFYNELNSQLKFYEGRINATKREMLMPSNRERLPELQKNLNKYNKKCGIIQDAIKSIDNFRKEAQELSKDYFAFSQLSTRLSKIQIHMKDDIPNVRQIEKGHNLSYKSSEKISKTALKISKNLYKKIKAGYKKKIMKNGIPFDQDSGFSYFANLDNRVKESSRVDIKRLEVADNIFFDRLKEGFKDDKLSYLCSQYKNKELIELREKCENIYPLSVEVWYLNELIESFKNSVISDTDMYSNLVNTYSQTKAYFDKEKLDIDKQYIDAKVSEKYEAAKNLEVLYAELCKYKLHLDSVINQKDYSLQEADSQRRLFVDVEIQMKNILHQYPDLNKPEYGIDIPNKKINLHIDEEPETLEVEEEKPKTR